MSKVPTLSIARLLQPPRSLGSACLAIGPIGRSIKRHGARSERKLHHHIMGATATRLHGLDSLCQTSFSERLCWGWLAQRAGCVSHPTCQAVCRDRASEGAPPDLTSLELLSDLKSPFASFQADSTLPNIAGLLACTTLGYVGPIMPAHKRSLTIYRPMRHVARLGPACLHNLKL